MANPVRIYTLFHPESKAAETLAEEIYDWFRLPSLAGIPVYIRSAKAKSSPFPLPIREAKKDTTKDTPGVLNYLLPLVDARLVCDMAWQDYLVGLAKECELSAAGRDATSTVGSVMFPVALDGTAANLRSDVRRLNFIRHHSDPGGDPRGDVEDTLKHLTEALARDLNGRIFPKQARNKLKIFISYARADGTETPKKIRDFIQSRTQCSAFFDENDIGYGTGFAEVIAENAGDDARALIVVRGDNYADRPWCRRELALYSRPREVLVPRISVTDPANPAAGGKLKVQFLNPLLVVDALERPRLTREIPELGQAPMLRWAPGREQLCFSMLLREVLLGARNVLAAQHRQNELKPEAKLGRRIWLNRLPNPLTLQQILNHEPTSSRRRIQVHYGGNDIPLTELELLRDQFPKVDFQAFHDIREGLPSRMRAAFERKQLEAPLAGRVITLSSSSPTDLNSLGYHSRHLREMLIYLVRPLISLGADVMYGGAPPKPRPGLGLDPNNLTTTLLGLISDERSHPANETQLQTPKGERHNPDLNEACAGRLFNPSQWPDCDRVSTEEEAAWINLCTLIRIRPKDAGLPECQDESAWPPGTPHTPKYLATVALVYRFARELTAHGFGCPIPGNRDRTVVPSAYVLIGGKLSGFTGLMPGIFEEFTHAMRHRRPVYIFGGLGGAAKELASALLTRPEQRPPVFTKQHYLQNAAANPNYARMLEGLSELNLPNPSADGAPGPDAADVAFDQLWEQIESAWTHPHSRFAALNNGLTDEQNQQLLMTETTSEAVQWVWRGLESLFLPET